MAISKKTRFEVFKRDGFKCQYCGKSAPDVVLQVDHIDPVSKGGKDDMLNLITSCADCNNGKSNRLLTDHSSLERQRAQLEELNIRREQLQMLVQWRDELAALTKDTIDYVAAEINKAIVPYELNEKGIADISDWLVKFSPTELLDALRISSQQYHGDVDKVLAYIPRIAAFRRQPEWQQKLRYIRGILRKRLSYVDEREVISLMTSAYKAGYSVEEIQEAAIEATGWRYFLGAMEYMIDHPRTHHNDADHA